MMLNFAKFSSGLTVLAATGFLIGAMLTDNGGQSADNKQALNQGPVDVKKMAETKPKTTAIDRIITSSIERVKQTENDEISVDDLLIMERINSASFEKVKKSKVVSPVKVSSSSVTVQPGDTLYGIGLKHGLTISEIASLNGISDPYTVRIGQKLRVN